MSSFSGSVICIQVITADEEDGWAEDTRDTEDVSIRLWNASVVNLLGFIPRICLTSFRSSDEVGPHVSPTRPAALKPRHHGKAVVVVASKCKDCSGARLRPETCNATFRIQHRAAVACLGLLIPKGRSRRDCSEWKGRMAMYHVWHGTHYALAFEDLYRNTTAPPSSFHFQPQHFLATIHPRPPGGAESGTSHQIVRYRSLWSRDRVSTQPNPSLARLD